MNYPVWEIPYIGGSLAIAVISIVHVYVAHFAVGGGLFLVLTEMKAYREKSEEILQYTKRHAKFFLLLTMVFGSITGVGIWFIISLVHPTATSVLIHAFVFGWAIEWVFFVGEIVSLFIYYYTFGRMDRRTHLLMGWLYFVFAWLSLFMINGIVAFMLTPGGWPESRDFWAGFFNPTFLPALCFRTFIALMLAGLFGFLTSTLLKDSGLREKMVRYCARWLLIPVLFIPFISYWYLHAVTDVSKALILGKSPEIIPFFKAFLWLLPALTAAGLVMAVRMPAIIKRPLAFLMVLAGLIYMGSFEWIREAGRRPFIIHGYMYSTGALPSDMMSFAKEGFLKQAKWARNKTITEENRLDAGRELFNLQCLPCHTIKGPYNEIMGQTKEWTYLGMLTQLKGQGKVKAYMPPFAGAEAEREALAEYLISGLHKKPKEASAPFRFSSQPVDIPPFDAEKDEYVLLAWNDLGMHCISDNDRWFAILPPANTLEAQLVKRGSTPEMISKGVRITYRVEPGFETPSSDLDFWNHAERVYGVRLKKDVGLTGNGLEGTMVYDPKRKSFVTEKVPVTPYRAFGADKVYNPYPLFTLEALDEKTGALLVQTKVVAPASTEMGCRNCHGGEWRWKGVSGVSDETARNILRVHDRSSRTHLLEDAESGRSRLCQGCHADPALGTEGSEAVLNFSASMHGWHAVYMSDMKADACALCHPASLMGNTRCGRDIHAKVGITCVDCHGTLEDHALSLLVGQKKKPKARELMTHIAPRGKIGKDEIRPRTPWIMEPDCLSCHKDFTKPASNPSAFNQWAERAEDLYRNRTDESGAIRCAACHGATHALYPAENPLGQDRDNIQPIQYSGTPYPIGSNHSCAVCHVEGIEESIHHANMEGEVRNKMVGTLNKTSQRQ